MIVDEAKLRLWLLCEGQAIQLRLVALGQQDNIEAQILKTKALQIAESLKKAGATAAGRTG
jgi:hypothetical protein